VKRSGRGRNPDTFSRSAPGTPISSSVVPNYVTILIALASAGLGGMGGAYLHARHERKESLWDRRIAAADDLATKLAQASMGAGTP
jgi:hypothetical protein